MTYDEFIRWVHWKAKLEKEWRLGQTYFNELYRVNPVLADDIRGTEADPFYQDKHIPEFLGHVNRYCIAFGGRVNGRGNL